ncbi:MAG: ankyrin repeat domain-containing protein [Candidatus Aminicenantales bacterium]
MFSRRTIIIAVIISMGCFAFNSSKVSCQEYSSEVKVAEIRFFRGGQDVPPPGQRKYSTRFPRSTTDIVYCQVEFINPLYMVETHTYPITWEFLKPDGTLFKEFHTDFTVKAETYLASYIKGLGWSQPGIWPPGTYSLYVHIGGKLIGSKQFTIYDDILPPLPESGKAVKSPFDAAVYEGDVKRVESLLEAGVDPNLKSRDGEYPLIIAILRENEDIVRLLLNHGADIHVKDAKGRPATMLARFKQNREIQRMMESAENVSLSGKWEGKWTNLEGYLYNFVANFKIGFNNRVEGLIEWGLRYSPRSEEQIKTGYKAMEYVQGSYNPDTRRVSLKGYKEDDPYGIINIKNYTLIISIDGKTLGGKAFSDAGETQFLAQR